MLSLSAQRRRLRAKAAFCRRCGLVRLVSVAEGASVAKGDRLVTMEAMKMELSLTAPRDGKVATVNVVAGDQVNEGALLVQLEEEHG